MREIQDHYFHKARKEGYPARSVYKLKEAQEKFRLLRPGWTVLDIGCRPGSWSMYAARVVGKRGRVVGIDLNPGKRLVVPDGGMITSLVADVMDPEIVSLLRNEAQQYDAVISDIAPRTTGNPWADAQHSLRLSRRVLEVALEVLRPRGNFYCKVFEGEDFPGFVAETRHYFNKVKVFKPASSRKESREVFVVGRELLVDGVKDSKGA